MKILLKIFVLSMIFTSCSEFHDNIKEQVQYIQCAKSAIANNNFLSIKISKHSFYNEIKDPTETFYLIYHYDKKRPSFTFINSDSTRFMKFDNKNYYLVDRNNREMARIKCIGEGKDAYWIVKNTTESVFKEITYYHQILGKKFILSNYLTHEKNTDTTIRDVNCRVFVSKTPMAHIYNSDTHNYDIPIQYSVHTYINTANNHIDSVCVKNITENNFKFKTTYIVSDISYNNKQVFLDSIFDFNNLKYYAYSYHDENNLPYSMRGSSNEEIDDDILDYPLISLNNDTTYLRDSNSWTLLNLWSLNCPSCIENLNGYKHEIESLGYRILEKEGIEILAINYSTDNMDILKNISEKTNSTDIIYSAKGFNGCISIPYLGYYYLISPDRKVVFKDYKLGDYSELLKAKEEYENK